MKQIIFAFIFFSGVIGIYFAHDSIDFPLEIPAWNLTDTPSPSMASQKPEDGLSPCMTNSFPDESPLPTEMILPAPPNDRTFSLEALAGPDEKIAHGRTPQGAMPMVDKDPTPRTDALPSIDGATARVPPETSEIRALGTDPDAPRPGDEDTVVVSPTPQPPKRPPNSGGAISPVAMKKIMSLYFGGMDRE